MTNRVLFLVVRRLALFTTIACLMVWAWPNPVRFV